MHTLNDANMAVEHALRKVLSAVQRYMPPDGISSEAAMSEIIAAVDPWPGTGSGGEGTIHQPIRVFLDWLYAELAQKPDVDPQHFADAQAALRIYTRFVAHRLGRVTAPAKSGPAATS